MSDAADGETRGPDPFAKSSASAEAMAREELARLKALGERMRSIGAETASMPDAEARAAIQDANLAAFEAASATVAGAALSRMRQLTADLDAALRPDAGSASDGRDAIAAGRETLEEAVRDIRAVREEEFNRLMGRLTEILGARRPKTTPMPTPQEREDWEPFEG